MVSASAGSQKSATTPGVSQSDLGALSPGSPRDGGPRLGSLSAPALTKSLRPTRRGGGRATPDKPRGGNAGGGESS